MTQNDPYKNFYNKGYEDVKNGKKSRVPHNYKLAYVSGRYDAVTNRPNRYTWYLDGVARYDAAMAALKEI